MSNNLRRRTVFALAITVLMAFGSGCALTQMSREQEIRLGQQTAAEVNAKGNTYEDPLVSRLGQQLAAASDRPDYPYRFRVITDKDINAFAMPGGPVYVTSAMMDFVKGHQDQLGAVLAHEITHIAKRHAVQQMERQAWLGLGIGALTSGNVQTAATLAANLEGLGYSRQHEREADKYGAVYLLRAGMDPQAEVRLWDRMAALGASGATFFQTHPGGSERSGLVSKQIQSGETRRLAQLR